MRILVTGATGTLGSLLLKKLASDGHEVIGISRDEFKQSLIPKIPNVKMKLCDVRNRDSLIRVSRGVDVIFHTAALKQVPKLEENPQEAILTNIDGTLNVLEAQRANGISRVVLSSTDKACYPVNIYGVTKAAAEKLILSHENNVVVRYGNVIGSRGSVVQAFAESLTKTKSIQLTDLEMTRFWLPQSRAVDFTLEAGLRGVPGLQIPRIMASPVTWLAESVAEVLEVGKFRTEIIGLRPGEKIHETLRAEHEGEYLFSGNPDLWGSKSFLVDHVKKVLLES